MIARILVFLALIAPATAAAQEVSPVLFLNRCQGGCIVNGGPDDARAMSSSIPCTGGASCGGGSCSCSGGAIGTFTIAEFRNAAGETGTAADAEWNAVVQCVREIYSPYNITVTDVLPANTTSHTQGIVAGSPSQIGYSGILGIAPGGLGCGAKDNVISFSFANAYGGTGMARVYAICAVAAQETGHSFGLDHAFEFSDGTSACNDPMTYRAPCGRHFFRNAQARCGEQGVRPCRCGGLQNAHAKLLSIFGPGTPLTPPPTLSVLQPAAGETVGNGAIVLATSAAVRGVSRVELWLNGYMWLTVKGAAFGSNGQPETTYPLAFPAEVPNSIVDIVVKSYDDIGSETVSPTITVTKGAACTTADTCAKGQKCEAGKCFWEAPVGEVGDACTYPQFCTSGTCLNTTEGQYCSQDCVVGVTDSCPTGFVCEGMAGQTGFCVNQDPDGAGCCGIGADGKTSALLSLFVVGLVLRRRRRR